MSAIWSASSSTLISTSRRSQDAAVDQVGEPARGRDDQLGAALAAR